MHEMSLAVSMIEQLDAVVAQHGASRIERIDLEIGAMSGVEQDAFEFVFPVAAEGTVAEGAELHFEEIPLELFCKACEKTSTTEEPLMLCPLCSSTAVDLVRGQDFLIKTMEVS